MKKPMNSVLNTDLYDRRRFGQLLEMSEKLKAVEQEGNELFPSFQPLMGDLWAGLFKMKPELLDEAPTGLEMNRQLMEQVMADEGYQEFREFTRLDDLAAALGTTKYSETVLGWVKEQAKQDQDLAEALQQLMDREQGASQQAADDLSTALSQNGKSLSLMLSRAAQETIEAKENVKSLLGGIQFGSGDGELKKVPLKDQLFLAEKLSHDKKLKEIAAWAGRMKLIANRKQRSKHMDATSRNGIRQGKDIEQLLPMELGSYASPISKMDFLRRYAEGQTLQYDTKGHEKLGKGPIILCLDQSGSMKNQDTISKGFALALMSIARKQRRDFAWIPFSSHASDPLIYERGKISVKDMIQLATVFLDGGTKFVAPLTKAAEVIKQSRFHQADIIFVTDGEAHVNDQFIDYWNELKKEKGFSVLSLLLGTESNKGVQGFSDRIVKASSFEDESVYQAFEI
ncbi:VWA domain-containing protein [Paenibacillus polymyxa]|uniref:VWA domain-containing protein n=1 Tax=Paenibacillus polymyxa TaxID=1406 RepID=UPI002AB343DE|nr:VWA domain-containing protein [Paenibacillus polymyxa]MDY7989892.1 VWA domain-containing protein [Paenibacillus polymyxa]MDY8116749.1 VWA domain-containing protein [Paenibacillus polymyxa]